MLFLLFVLISMIVAHSSSSDSSEHRQKDKHSEWFDDLDEHKRKDKEHKDDKTLEERSETTEKTTEDATTTSLPIALTGFWYATSKTTKNTEYVTAQPDRKGCGDSSGRTGESDKDESRHAENPFFTTPRSIDVWDRLLVLAAFPICFF
uniref:Uncharacterized protein n=1 Tax=Caenorhabditis japonica TaxID=281687 RepID=A0A8R1INS8_CAEJA